MTITTYCSTEHAPMYYRNNPNMIICKYTDRKAFEKYNPPLNQHSLSIWGVYKDGEYGIRTKERRHTLYPWQLAKLKYSIIYIPHRLYHHINVKKAFPYAQHIYICDN